MEGGREEDERCREFFVGSVEVGDDLRVGLGGLV